MTEKTDFSLIVGFSTDMGNAEDAALTFTEGAQAAGINAEAIELNQIPLDDVANASHFVVVTSTFGDGEFPDNGVLFWEAISADDAPRLEHLHFAVLALGDSAYDLFCNAGKILDERLEALGATRMVDRVDIDGFYEKQTATWTEDVVKHLTAATAGADTGAAVVAPPEHQPHHPDGPGWDRANPFAARLVVNRLLTTAESDKEVRHYEIDLADSGIRYQAGDSLAVQPINDPELVEAILTALGVGADHRVADHDAPLGELLSHTYEIRTPSRALQALIASRTRDSAAAAILGGTDHEALHSWLYGRDVVDLLQLAELSAEEVIDTLRPLTFRDYSIASSPLVHPNRVHLTVATVRHQRAGRWRGGVASTYLAYRGDTIAIHLRPNNTFRLPAPDAPIIMIGPGTGIAPFRAFLQERQATAATGANWLFFGDRRRACDYLYGEELADFSRSGVLTRLNLAFSRDRGPQEPKEYVQHHMIEHGAELYRWLQDGAYIYVCGDADAMAKDVDHALHQVIAAAAGVDHDTAHAYVNDLIRQHRYVRDVY